MWDLQTIHRLNNTTEREAKAAAKPIFADGPQLTARQHRRRQVAATRLKNVVLILTVLEAVAVRDGLDTLNLDTLNPDSDRLDRIRLRALGKVRGGLRGRL